MEKKIQVHFYRPEPFCGYIGVPDEWDEMDYDEQREILDLFFQENCGIRTIEVDEFDCV